MKRFNRDTDREIYETRFTADIPDYVTIAAHETMRVLMAARSLQDVGVLGSIVRWHKVPDRYGLVVESGMLHSIGVMISVHTRLHWIVIDGRIQ